MCGTSRDGRRLRHSSGNWGSDFWNSAKQIIIEWGTWGRSERDALRLGAKALGAAVELHYVSAPVEVLFERIQRRGMEDPPIRREQVQQWANAFDVPTSEEMALYDKPQSVHRQ